MTRQERMALALAYQQANELQDPDAPSDVDKAAQRVFGLDPKAKRSMLLPHYDKQTGFTAPEMVYQAAKAFVAPGVAMQGGNVGAEDAMNVASNVMGGGLASSAMSPVTGAVAGMGADGGAFKNAMRSTIKGAQRKAFPGIYKDPRTAVQEAEMMVAPESPNLSRLFGVTREDLAKAAETPGTAAGVIPGATAKPRGAASVEPIMQKANTKRLVDILQATQEYAPKLATGMKGWYMMDPAYNRLVDLVGEQEAGRMYSRLNALTSMASPSSDVVTELRRGTAANKLAQEGRFNEFFDLGGLDLEARQGMNLPQDLLDFPSHAYHSTAQAPAMQQYLETGQSQMKSPKVPLYMQASQASALGRQSNIPVGDAHFSRGVGLADTRDMLTIKGQEKIPAASVSKSELQTLTPWWREQVAKQAGLEAVPGQATLWGALAPQTGVDTVIGAPKLEILSDLIAKTSKRLNIPMEQARDMVLTGKAQAGKVDPNLLGVLAAGAGGAAAVDAYRRKKEEK
jgi:hypothetical protein